MITGLDLDLAIQGEALPNGGGFSRLRSVQVSFYTRAGSFESFMALLLLNQFKPQFKD